MFETASSRLFAVGDVCSGPVKRITSPVDECARPVDELLEENRSRLDSIAEKLHIHESLYEAAAHAAAGIERVPPS